MVSFSLFYTSAKQILCHFRLSSPTPRSVIAVFCQKSLLLRPLVFLYFVLQDSVFPTSVTELHYTQCRLFTMRIQQIPRTVNREATVPYSDNAVRYN